MTTLKNKVEFADWKREVMRILSHCQIEFSDYQLKYPYRDGLTPKQAIRYLLGY